MISDSMSVTEYWKIVWFLFVLPLLCVALYLNALPMFISLPLLVASAAIATVINLRQESQFTLLDIGLSLYTGAVGLSCWHSVYAPNSILELQRVTIGMLLYASLRCYSVRCMEALSLCLSLLGAGAALDALLHWFRSFILVRQAGFTNLLPFRRNLSWGGVDGYSGNEALRFLIFCGLSLLCMLAAPRRRLWMLGITVSCLYLNVICLLLTLSRLVFVTLITSAMILLALMFWNGIRLRLNILAMIAGVGVLTVLLGMAFGIGGEVVEVVSMAKTPGQLRSITGRAVIAGHGWELLRQHWQWGVGAGNYGYESCIGRSGDDGCAPEAFNWFLQTALELGIVGLLSVLVLWAGVIWSCIQHCLSKRASLWDTCALSVSVAMLVFNVGQSAMFFNLRLTVLCVVWFAILATGGESTTECENSYIIS